MDMELWLAVLLSTKYYQVKRSAKRVKSVLIPELVSATIVPDVRGWPRGSLAVKVGEGQHGWCCY